MNYVLKQLKKELDYYLDYAVSQSRAGAPNMEIIMIHIEKIVNSYRRGLIKLHYNTPADAALEDRAVLERAKKRYCQLVKTFSESVEEYKIGPFSGEQLQELW